MEAAVTITRERRRAVRLTSVSEHGVRVIKIRPGDGATLIEVSAAGALVETHRRLLPGSAVELHMETDHQKARVRGTVVHCSVVRVGPACVAFRGAIEFERHLPWFAPDHGYRFPSWDRRSDAIARADATQCVI
jgi:hypothetical protein